MLAWGDTVCKGTLSCKRICSSTSTQVPRNSPRCDFYCILWTNVHAATLGYPESASANSCNCNKFLVLFFLKFLSLLVHLKESPQTEKGNWWTGKLAKQQQSQSSDSAHLFVPVLTASPSSCPECWWGREEAPTGLGSRPAKCSSTAHSLYFPAWRGLCSLPHPTHVYEWTASRQKQLSGPKVLCFLNIYHAFLLPWDHERIWILDVCKPAILVLKRLKQEGGWGGKSNRWVSKEGRKRNEGGGRDTRKKSEF